MYDIAALRRRQKSGARIRKPCFYKRWGFLASALILALVSAGCGSSGGGSSSSSTLLDPIRNNPDLRVVTGERIADVSRAIPSVDSAGTVVQSSNFDDASRTMDTLGAVDIRLDSSGQLEGSVTLGPEDTGTTLTVADDLFAHGSVFFGQGFAVRRVDISHEIPNADDDGSDTILMRVYSSVPADADDDTDYFAAGVWVRTPTDTESANDTDPIEVGAFAAGFRHFDAADIQALTGTASYEGVANGLYTYADADSSEVGFFDATLALEADFGGASGLGSISGTLSEFTDEDGEALEGFDGNFALGVADITNANDGGFFQGTIQRDEGNFNGNWGGAFHGVREDGNPAAVHGTFGVRGAPEGGGVSRAVGVFAAPQTSSTP